MISKSFANSERVNQWSARNKILPINIPIGSNKKFWFDCDVCSHSFLKALNHITLMNSWCPFCSNQRLCDELECNTCFMKSFASSDKSMFWSARNKKDMRMVFKSSGNKYLFNCGECLNEFAKRPADIKKGGWCNICKNKTEAKFLRWFNKTFSDVVITHQAKFNWCKSELDKYMPFDFCIESMKIIIEIDGPQHFIQVSNWMSPEETQIRDKYKERLAEEHGYKVYRILQKDIWFDKNNWQEVIHELRNGLLN